jgi:sulfoxide reductase heme-binding subunit YedZ
MGETPQKPTYRHGVKPRSLWWVHARSNWRWAALNLFAGSVLAVVWTQGSTDYWNTTQTFDTMLESGKWAIRFLLICLTMTPLQTYLGWRGAAPLRKPAGLWAFGFALLHVLVYVQEVQFDWLAWPMQNFLALGLLGLVVLMALAATSNRWAMRRLGKSWKRLHRLVYAAGIAVTCHAMLATTMSKKMFMRDPQAIHELRIYLAVLVVLLVVRVPLVRRLFKQRLWRRRPQPRVTVPVVPIHVPDHTPKQWPRVFEHETGLPQDGLSTEIQPMEDNERQKVAVG